MIRDTQQLRTAAFDVLIIGGGIYGGALAREAATRGLKTALIEQADFCSGSSANSLKIVHGGLRYLQQADIPRVMESIRERRILLRTAPHLVSPMPCIMPTRGLAMKSRPVMAIGMLANDIISFHRNRHLLPSRRIPMGYTLSKEACLEILPSMRNEPVTGAACWHDALALDTERLVIDMLKAAAAAGACVANYVKAEAFMMEGNRVTGVSATDQESSETFNIRAGMVINAAGPWEGSLLDRLPRPLRSASKQLALAVNLVIKNWPIRSHAAGLQSAGTRRLYFFVPWRGVTLAGTYYRSHSGSPDQLRVTEDDITAYLDAINSCLPGVVITRDDVLAVHAGILPCRRAPQPDREPDLLRHYQFTNHARTDGIEGLVSVLGIKYTTARGVAESVISALAPSFKTPLRPSSTRHTPLPGGDISNPVDVDHSTVSVIPATAAEMKKRLRAFYGSESKAILSLAAGEGLSSTDADALLQAEVLYVIRNEMPRTLGDLLYRRTGIAAAGKPTPRQIQVCAETMSRECHWDAARTASEIQAVTAAQTLWQAACLKPLPPEAG